MISDKKTVVVLGGGIGGLVTARKLRKKLGREHRIVVIDKSDKHVFSPSFLWLMTGQRQPQKIVRDLDGLAKHGIEVIIDDIIGINPAERLVHLKGQDSIQADYIVISLGADLDTGLIPGLESAGHNLYSLDGAVGIRDTRTEFKTGRLVVLVASMPFKCPAAPYEAALLLDDDLRKRGVRSAVTVDVYSPEPGPMGVAGPEMSGAVRQMMSDRDIAYHPQQRWFRLSEQRYPVL